VININEAEYDVRIFQEHDRRADPYLEARAPMVDGVIRVNAPGCEAAVTKDGFTGTLKKGDKVIQFEMKRVERLSPTLGAPPPEGAIVLFDGSSFEDWQHKDDRAASWRLLGDGAMEVRSAKSPDERKSGIGGDIRTKRTFTDCKLHVEFRYPVEPGKAGQGRGNSGVFLQDTYEVQVLNSYGLQGFWNECGALYKAEPPRVNAAAPPLQWQTYDITYTAPRWQGDRKIANARMTVQHNGIPIHIDQEIPWVTAHSSLDRSKEPREPGPIRLQDHGNAIQYRNIWLVPMDAAAQTR
jgi:hypothetical protein